MLRNDIGLIGLAVMGQNLAVNISNKGYNISVFNRTPEKSKEFINGLAKGKTNINTFFTINEFVSSLQRPRKIIIMIKAGEAVDNIINSLTPLINKGDIIIDCGNSFYRDTVRRSDELYKNGILFMGVGISGGEEGALKGPSIMPGGSKEAWFQVKDIFESIAAKAQDNVPCCDYIGQDGAGHFVKMIHNGIEYGDMQLISETYYIMKELLGMSADEMQKVYAEWNDGELNSYLIEITADIMGKTDDDTGKPMIDIILDAAKDKGTGKWTSREAMELGIPIPTITEALYARYMSARKKERIEASGVLKGPEISIIKDRDSMLKDIKKALYASKICSYAQGFDLLKRASAANDWNLDVGKISMLWRSGCIIRARFLEKIKEAYDCNKDLTNLMLDQYFKEVLNNSQEAWREVVSVATSQGVPVPSLSSSLVYYDSYRRDMLPANLIQAQRDYFGSHTYERVDRAGTFHTEWKKITY